jgi:hypothetical protein
MKDMKLKILLMMVMASLAVFALTACGGDETAPAAAQATPTPTPAAPAETPEPTTPEATEDEDDAEDTEDAEGADDDLDFDTEFYLEMMYMILSDFEFLVEDLALLMEYLLLIETDEDFEDWYDAFFFVGDGIYEVMWDLEEMAEFAPEEYLEAHIVILAGVQLVYDSLYDLYFALESMLMGDFDGMMAGLEDMVTSLLAAELLWVDVLPLFM